MKHKSIFGITPINFSNNTLNDNQVGFKLWGCDLQHNLHSIDTTNTVAVTIYKRRLRKLRNKKHMSCKHELLEMN